MKLTDVAAIEVWQELEKEIENHSGLNASIFDAAGSRIANTHKWANPICPLVKASEKGQTFICSLAHQNVSNMAMKSKSPVIDECDAGFAKMVVPIFCGDEFIGVAGGCGLLQDGGEVDTFLIHKTTGIDEEELEPLTGDIKTISDDQLEELSAYLTEKVKNIVKNIKN
ncbi:PocR ligand-binding domain-containing protein [bacterium]|nr:PocR ligand-binding domain-containing protein [bacterium]